jgi:SH3 domain-containing YSC84-like protein 1
MHQAHRTLYSAPLRIGLTTAALALGACSSSNEHAQSPAAVDSARTDALARLDESTDTVTQLHGKIDADVAARARCVVVVPSLKKGGLIVGGQSGRGFATCMTDHGWSAPGPVQVSGGTFGAQIGFQSSDVLALVTSDKAMRTLEAGSLKVGVDASAAAGPVGVGRGRQFGDAEVLSYTRSSGLFAGATLDGTGIQADPDAIVALYGSTATFGGILEGLVAPPPHSEVKRFLGAMRETFPPKPIASARLSPLPSQ